MSAIAGILYFHGGQAESGLIQNLTGAMKSRGPDEQTHWRQGPIALGHCMLRTTPESIEEHQPLQSQDGSLVIVWDGRLDNRSELRRDLSAAGAVLRDNTDVELALQSYAIWREECPKRFLGDFAFAVWDVGRKQLFCARDHMGARPFYYTRNDRFFAFASEEEVLTHLPGVSRSPNEDRIAYFLVPAFSDLEYQQSWFEDVWSLAASESITIKSEGTELKNIYWKLEPGEESNYSSDEECQSAFLEVMRAAVLCRIRCQGEVSVMMSGGLDSASVVAMIRRVLPELGDEKFHTYSAIADNPSSCVESQSILSLAKGQGGHSHFLSVPSFTGMLDVKDLVDNAWSNAHPIDNSIMLPALMCRAASQNGHRVMLHGVCGDLVTYVPHRYIALLLLGRQWRAAWAECRGANINNNYMRGAPPIMLLLENLKAAFAPEVVKWLSRKIRLMKSNTAVKQSLINREFAERVGLEARMRATTLQNVLSLRDIQKQHIRVMSPPHGITSGLSGYDRVAGRYGLELRDPWGDRRVVEFFLRLPLTKKIRSGWTKYLVRKAFETDLPREVIWRVGKEHLGWTFYHRLMDESQELANKIIEQDLDIIERYVDKESVRKVFKKYCLEKGDEERERVYDIMTLAIWVKALAVN